MRWNGSRFLIALSIAGIMILGCTGPEDAGNREKSFVGDIELEDTTGGDPGSTHRTLVILGASYAQNWKVHRLAGMQVVNKGVAGQTTLEILQRFPDDIIALKPCAVVLWGFINDIHRASRDEMPAALERAKEDIREMVRLAKQNGVEPILATDVTIRREAGWRSTLAEWAGWIRRKESYQSYVNRQVHEINRWIREFAREKGITLLDFEPLLTGKNGYREKRFATPDGTHISEAAYRRLTLHAEEVLGKSLACSSPASGTAPSAHAESGPVRE